MERIISDIYSKGELRLWEIDPDSFSTKEFNRKITAVNNMYAWLYEKGILEKVSFEFKDYSDVTYFAVDAKDLEPYRKDMEACGLKDALLAVQHIFDEEYTPCNFSGAIELTWTMNTYRDVDGCVSRSWENALVQGLDNKAIADLPYISADKGVKEAVKVLFERCEFVPSDLVKEEGLSLPDCVTISAATLALDTDDIYKDSEELSDIIGDYLSNEYGYCHSGFAFDVTYNEFKEPSEVVVTDIEWDIYKVVEESLKSDWVLTDPDDLQLRRQPNVSDPKVFELIQVDTWPMEEKTSYKLAVGEIDLNDYTDEEIASMLVSYGYDDMAALVSAAGSENEAYGQLAEMFMEVYTPDFYVCEFDSWNAAVDEVEQRTGVDLNWLREKEKPLLDNLIKSAAAVKTDSPDVCNNERDDNRDER